MFSSITVRISFFILFLSAFCNPLSAEETKKDSVLSSDNPADKKMMAQLPIELNKVKDFILNKDYPEVFGDKHYRVAIKDYKVIDFGHDGLTEVVVLFEPHYLQSPTIVIYQIQKDGAVKKIMEALAPGPLVKRGGYYLDSHVLSEGVDLTLSGTASSINKEKFIKIALDKKGFGNIVQYKKFFHADNRSGEHTYIDMTNADLFDDTQTCAKFEFSNVDSIEVGSGKEKSDNYIAATVGNQIYRYEIAAIREDGFLDKKLTIIDSKNLPKGTP